VFAVLFLPKFRLQAALRWQEELSARAVAIVDEDNVVVECTEAAEQRHVGPGLDGVQAQARCADIVLRSRALAIEEAVQGLLLEVAGSLSPEMESTSGGCATVDLRGAQISNWNGWAAQLVERFRALELKAQIGVGPNPDLAFIAARKARPALVVQSPTAFLAQLALTEIDPPPHLQALLHEWGIHTLGQLTSLPRGEFADRLGPDADRLWQRASGQVERLLRLVRPSEEFAEAFDFEREIETVEPLLFILRRFLDQLTQRLAGCHRVAAHLTLTLPLEDGTGYERAFTIPSPTDDAEVLFRILHTHLESLQMTARPTGARLRITPVSPEHQQLRLFESPLRDPNRFGETLARLAALVGQGNVGVAEWENSYRADAVRVVSPRFHELPEPRAGHTSFTVGLPLRRFRPGIAATVRVLKPLPAEVESAVVSGEITEALGPYRASGNWWEDERWGVEEWDIEVGEHGLYRLRRDNADWCIEGCYDAELH
jgi:protein ImuB